MAFEEHDESHHQGLERDLQRMATDQSRRRVLRFLAAGVSLAPFAACGVDTSGTSSDGSPGTTPIGPDGGVTSCSKIPEETAGPYPGDGSNGANALAVSGIVRSDIRSSIGGAGGTAGGIPLTVTLTLVNAAGSCESLQGYAIYLWHCDREGRYSLYSSGITNENYLRGVQVADANGQVTFKTIFPACYSGRWPHIHFEIYPSVTLINASSNKIATSQLALLKTACDAVYATSGYSQSVNNLAQASLATDNVFRDGTTLQLPNMTGNVTDGYTASLVVGINP